MTMNYPKVSTKVLDEDKYVSCAVKEVYYKYGTSSATDIWCSLTYTSNMPSILAFQTTILFQPIWPISTQTTKTSVRFGTPKLLGMVDV